MSALPATAGPYPRYVAEAPNWAEQGQFIVSALGVLLTLGALYFVWRQIRATRQEGQADRVAALIHRHQDRAFQRIMVASLRYVRTGSAEECYDRLLAWEDALTSETPLLPVQPGSDEPVPSMNDCRHVMLYLEEVGGLYHAGAIDTALTDRVFHDMIVRTFDVYWWLVHALREGRVGSLEAEHHRVRLKAPEEQKPHETSSYVEWEALARTFNLKHPDVYSLSRTDEVWIVCRPPDVAYRDAYLALTRDLTCGFADLARLEEALGVGSAQPDPVPNSVLCIAPWQRDIADHLRCQRIAAAIVREIADDPSLTTLGPKLEAYLRPTSSTQVAPPSPHGASAPTPSPPRR